MLRVKPFFEIDREFIIQRYETGIKLFRPEQVEQARHTKTSVYDLLQLPINFYFMDRDSILQKVNAQTALTCGYLSKYDAIGKSIRDVSKKDEVRHILYNDRKVVITKNLKIADEHYTRLDNTELTAISIKFPWFNEKNKVIGILGCSILTGMTGVTPLTASLTMLMQTGLLAPSLTRVELVLPGVQLGEIYIDKRDKDILFLLTRGKTAKEIAKILNRSPRTIEHRLENIKIKLNSASKSELIDKIIDYFK